MSDEFSTPDICDAQGEVVRVLPPQPSAFMDYGLRLRFAGPVATVRCPADNSRVAEMLEMPGQGRVLVVDAGAITEVAMLGDRLATAAVRNGWQGVLVNGCVRDVEVLARLDLGIKALGSCPRRSHKRGLGEAGAKVRVAGVTICPGNYLYADSNGILIAEGKIPLS